MAMDLPEPAVALLDQRFEGSAWAMLHAWVSDETILAVIAVAPEAAFDVDEDTFDVDVVRVEHVQLLHDTDEGWTLEVDGEVDLRSVFEELVAAHEGDNGGDAPLES